MILSIFQVFIQQALHKTKFLTPKTYTSWKKKDIFFETTNNILVFIELQQETVTGKLYE